MLHPESRKKKTKAPLNVEALPRESIKPITYELADGTSSDTRYTEKKKKKTLERKKKTPLNIEALPRESIKPITHELVDGTSGDAPSRKWDVRRHSVQKRRKKDTGEKTKAPLNVDGELRSIYGSTSSFKFYPQSAVMANSEKFMARTKQTARRSTGGPAPHTSLSLNLEPATPGAIVVTKNPPKRSGATTTRSTTASSRNTSRHVHSHIHLAVVFDLPQWWGLNVVQQL
ncbi:hypothetical protein L208DRAFT_1477241 [Tricholoma matsutake]|nr:hypothetical protein L208DRAFT_1477241 [Tricholoma matsutake 945]